MEGREAALGWLGELPGKFDATGWVCPPYAIPFELWEHNFGRLKRKTYQTEADLDKLRWALADWLIYGEALYEGDAWAQAVDELDYSRHSLSNIARIARGVPKSVRRDDVRFWTHSEVVGLPADSQRIVLEEAGVASLKRDEVRDLASVHRKRLAEENQAALPFAEEVEALKVDHERDTCPTCGGEGTVPKGRLASSVPLSQ